MKLSEQLKQDHECGDFGSALEGYAERAEKLEQVVTDEYINTIFDGSNFGEATNNSVKKKRDQLAKTLKDQMGGYWSGHTAYNIAV